MYLPRAPAHGLAILFGAPGAQKKGVLDSPTKAWGRIIIYLSKKYLLLERNPLKAIVRLLSSYYLINAGPVLSSSSILSPFALLHFKVS